MLALCELAVGLLLTSVTNAGSRPATLAISRRTLVQGLPSTLAALSLAADPIAPAHASTIAGEKVQMIP